MTVIERSPTVSVLMCVYNGASWVSEAVDSVLQQTYPDFEFVIVDDGSTDHTASILEGYHDPRMRVLRQPHLGIPKARNHALSFARGEYVAVLDADDIAHPTRLARQADFLERNPSIVAVGTGYLHVDTMRSRTIEIVPPLADAAIRRAMVTGNPLCHSSVMMRRDALKRVGLYDESFRYLQDYELWSRLAQVGELRNLEEVLVTRRYHERSVTNDFSTELLRMCLFWRASTLAIDRLEYPWWYRLWTLRSMGILFGSHLYAAGHRWWRKDHSRQHVNL